MSIVAAMASEGIGFFMIKVCATRVEEFVLPQKNARTGWTVARFDELPGTFFPQDVECQEC